MKQIFDFALNVFAVFCQYSHDMFVPDKGAPGRLSRRAFAVGARPLTSYASGRSGRRPKVRSARPSNRSISAHRLAYTSESNKTCQRQPGQHTSFQQHLSHQPSAKTFWGDIVRPFQLKIKLKTLTTNHKEIEKT